MRVPIVYEDAWLLVVDKPAGLAVHPAQGVNGPDLLSLLRQEHAYVALLHRLDREASGLIVASTDRRANAALQHELEGREIERVYAAVVAGQMTRPLTVDRPISSRSYGRAALRRKPPRDAAPARSHFVPLKQLAEATLVEAHLDTGRKHQLRIHAASLGHPIYGDRRYGGPPAPRLALHATRLRLHHPQSRDVLVLESPLPAELEAMLGRSPDS